MENPTLPTNWLAALTSGGLKVRIKGIMRIMGISMEAYDHWIAFGLLGLIGGKMIWESFSPEEEHHFNPCRLRTQLLLAVATSIDALAVGISFACTGYTALSQLTLPLLLIGLVSFLFSIIGYHLGRCFGKTIIRRLNPELVGGTILILIGVKVLMSHLLQ
jgi:putative Mn2+ efflux pump MntP